MNKINKIFLFIIIVLIISLVIAIYFCIQNLNNSLRCAEQLYLKTKAIDDAGLECKIQDDGSYVLVKREVPLKSEVE